MSEASTRAAVREWARRFNAGEYFEAHEVLEAAWLEAPATERDLLKGLIQAAVALYHYGRGNGHGARVKYSSSTAYLRASPSPAYGLDVRDLAVRMDRFFAPLVAASPGTPPPAALLPWPTCRLEEG